MQICQTTFGVFHSFELAHQLQRRGWLRRIYTTWPWARVKREGLARELVGTFPAVHTPDYLLGRTRFYPQSLQTRVKRWNATTFDAWTERVMPECDALIGISGTSLRTGARVQAQSGRFVCDRGSSHHRFQERIVREEHARWGVAHKAEDPWVIERDEASYALADAVTVPSGFAASTFVELGVPAAKVHVIPYGVRLERFQRVGVAADVRERFEVVFAGHVSLRKGVPYLLEAFARVKHPSKRLRVVGAMDARLEGILGRFQTEGVEFLGAVPQSRLPEIFLQQPCDGAAERGGRVGAGAGPGDGLRVSGAGDDEYGGGGSVYGWGGGVHRADPGCRRAGGADGAAGGGAGAAGTDERGGC